MSHRDPNLADAPTIYGNLPQGALLAAIVDSSDDAIISKNLNSIITSWNQGARRIFGYTAEEMIGKSVTLLIPPERQDEEPRILAQLVRGQRVDHFETIRVTKSGQRLDISLTISPIRDEHGRVVGASKIARDITERKRAEEVVRRALLEAHEASRAKDQFLAALSHELRTPLMPALMQLSILKRQAREHHPEHLPSLEMIERNLRTESRLIDDLLDLSRIVQKKCTDFQMEKVHLRTVVEKAIQTCEWSLQSKNLKLEVDWGAGDWVVFGDEVRLEQVFWNVLQNAVKFTPAGGRIQLFMLGESAWVEVRLVDQGIGFEGRSEDLFKPFYQQAPQYGGLGMGLSISKAILNAHQGSIELASAGQGHGTRVTIRLPLAKS